MKEVSKFNKKSVYSDVEPTRSDATILKCVGKIDNNPCFRVIGGSEEFYAFTEHPDWGRVIEYGETSLYELSKEEIQELIKQGKIKEQ